MKKLKKLTTEIKEYIISAGLLSLICVTLVLYTFSLSAFSIYSKLIIGGLCLIAVIALLWIFFIKYEELDD